MRRVEALPGVRAAFASNLVPLSNGGGGGTVVVDGRPAVPNERAGIAFIGVTPHFNATLGLVTTRGRDFTEAEGWSHTPVAVINQTMATRFWADRDPVGGRFRLAEDQKSEWFTVVGVTPDANVFGIDPSDEQPPAVAYVPFAYQQLLNMVSRCAWTVSQRPSPRRYAPRFATPTRTCRCSRRERSAKRGD